MAQNLDVLVRRSLLNASEASTTLLKAAANAQTPFGAIEAALHNRGLMLSCLLVTGTPMRNALEILSAGADAFHALPWLVGAEPSQQ